MQKWLFIICGAQKFHFCARIEFVWFYYYLHKHRNLISVRELFWFVSIQSPTQHISSRTRWCILYLFYLIQTINPSCLPNNWYQCIRCNTPSLDLSNIRQLPHPYCHHPFKLNSAICSFINLYLCQAIKISSASKSFAL